MTIKPVTPATKSAVLHVAESCGLFQPEELGELNGMIDALIAGLDGFDLTRKFYNQHSYTIEARIRDYYQEGEDKVVFWKKL